VENSRYQHDLKILNVYKLEMMKIFKYLKSKTAGIIDEDETPTIIVPQNSELSVASSPLNVESKAHAVASSKTEHALWNGKRRNVSMLKQYRTIYNEGAIITQAINAYADFMMSDDYVFVGNDAGLVQMVKDWADNFNFYEVVWGSIVDALVFGDSYDEIIWNTTNSRVLRIGQRQSWLFDTEYDLYGKIICYRQYPDSYTSYIKIPSNRVMHLRLMGLPGAENGLSLIGNAFDDICRDVKMAESAAAAIQRHAFPIWHVRVGETGEEIPDEVLDELQTILKNLSSKNEVITPKDIEIIQLNNGGIAGLTEISQYSLERTLASMGVPLEVVGLGSTSSTYATATVTLQAFTERCRRMARSVEYSYNSQIIDKITGIPGSVRLKLGGVE